MDVLHVCEKPTARPLPMVSHPLQMTSCTPCYKRPPTGHTISRIRLSFHLLEPKGKTNTHVALVSDRFNQLQYAHSINRQPNKPRLGDHPLQLLLHQHWDTTCEQKLTPTRTSWVMAPPETQNTTHPSPLPVLCGEHTRTSSYSTGHHAHAAAMDLGYVRFQRQPKCERTTPLALRRP